LTDEFKKLKEDNNKEFNTKDNEWIKKYDRKYDKLVKEVDSIDLDNYSLQPLKGQFEYTNL